MSTNYKTRRTDYTLTKFHGGVARGQCVQIGTGWQGGFITLPLDKDVLLDLTRDLLDLCAGDLQEEP